MSASPRARQQDPPDGDESSDREASDGEPSSRGSDGGSEERNHHGGHSDTSPLEWVLAAFSALLILGAIGHFLYEALAEPATPPEVRVTVEAIRRVGDGYLVEFRAENRGHATAARVNVEGTLERGMETVETASATIDYVPASGSRRGGLYFTEDPRAYELEVRPTGYDRP